MTLDLSTKVKGIGEMLKHTMFAVPEHQRTYAWTTGQVTDLWTDVTTAMREEPDGYFLGQVVLGQPTDGSDRSVVIDGQQRLATVSLFYAALVAEFRRRTDDEKNALRAENLEHTYLADADLVSTERSFYLKMGPHDNGYFESLLNHAVGGHDRPTPERESHELLSAAYDKLREKLAEDVPGQNVPAINRIADLAKYLRSQVTVIEVQAGSEDNAFVIFETLNDRGVRLTPADLLKNLLFARSKSKIAEVTLSWSTMLGTLEVLDDDSTVTTFIRHFWISTRGPVRDRLLYKTIKDTLDTPTKVATFASQLAKAAETYVALTNPEALLWTTTQEREAVRVVKLFKAKTVRPLMLAIAQETSDDARRKLIVAAADWTVRLTVSGRLGSGTTEDGAGAAARAVRSGKAGTPAKLATALGASYVANSDFESSFATFKVRNSRQARYFLGSLEVKRRELDKLSPELAPEIDEKIVNLEHILPKNPQKEAWSAFSRDDVGLYSPRLGNQVLMQTAWNRRLKADEYEKKEDSLRQSELALTSETAGHTAWGRSEINDRQKRLAALAVQVW